MKKFFTENQIEAFVFDMDGVVLDSESVYEKAWRVIAEKMHVSDIDSVHEKCLGLSEQDVFKLMAEKYGDDFDGKLFWKLTSDWSMEYMNESGVPEKKGAREILEFLKSEKIPVALATSSGKSFAEKLLEKANLIQYFDLMIFGDEVSRAKPDPEIYETSCRKLGLAPEKCVAVEDSPNGIKSAVSAGLKAVMVPDRIPADGDMKKLAWKISDSLLSLKKIMEEQ